MPETFGKRRGMSHESRRPMVRMSRMRGMLSPPPTGTNSPLASKLIIHQTSGCWPEQQKGIPPDGGFPPDAGTGFLGPISYNKPGIGRAKGISGRPALIWPAGGPGRFRREGDLDVAATRHAGRLPRRPTLLRLQPFP